MEGEPIQVEIYEEYYKIILNNNDSGNTIDATMIHAIHEAIDSCTKEIIVIEGGENSFCEGANFSQISEEGSTYNESCAEQMYQLWVRMRREPFIFISHVKGRVNAGGIGFIAASDIVISDESATYSLSELLFGLYPACVLPFLINKIGFQKSNYMTLMTKTFTAKEACDMGLVDCVDKDSERIMKRHIQRLKYIKHDGLEKYKLYLMNFSTFITEYEDCAVKANKAMFLNTKNQSAIFDFVSSKKMPWE